MEDLSLENILDGDGLNLFNDIENTDPDTKEEEGTEENDDKTAEINPEGLFGTSESVGSEEDKEDTTPKSDSSSPKADFFSSIAEALAEEGIFPDLEEETIKGIKSPEDFRKVVDDYIKSELNEQQLRIKEALEVGVNESQIRSYENVLTQLRNIPDNLLEKEDEESEELRKKLIYQDYINKGFSQERAFKEVDKSLKNGTDIEDAKEALNSALDFYATKYNNVIEKAREEKKSREEEEFNIMSKIDKTIMESDSFFGDFRVDKATRQKIRDNVSNPTYKDPETGRYLTAIQKYEKEHKEDFIINLGILYTLTDGFKSLDKLVDKKARKEVKKGLRELEDKINNSSRDLYGNLHFTSGVSDENSYIGKGLRLDI